MKQKKLFGKLNWIDILVLLVLLVLIAVVALFAYKTLRPAATNDPENKVTSTEPNLTFCVVCDDVSAELAENIKASIDGEDIPFEGQPVSPRRIYNGGILMNAEIIDCTIVETDDPALVQLRFSVQARATISSGAYVIGVQEVRIANDYIVKTVDVEISGTIISMEKRS